MVFPRRRSLNKARSHYPQSPIGQVAELAHISSRSTSLEVGCSPGTATVTFAELDCSITSLEPNPDFYAIALQNCSPYPKVEIRNMSFEGWQLDFEPFDAELSKILAEAWRFHP